MVKQLITSRNTNNRLLELEVKMTCIGGVFIDFNSVLYPVFLSFWFLDNRDGWFCFMVKSFAPRLYYLFKQLDNVSVIQKQCDESSCAVVT